MTGDLFYRIGAALGTVDQQLRNVRAGMPQSAREVAVYDPENGDDPDDGSDTLEDVALTAAGAWLASRLLKPKPVSWTRVVFAGLAATALTDMFGRTADDAEPGELPYAADPEELMGRLGAGIAIAAGYAALIYPRLPGPPLLRGLAFGALEIAAAPRGGLVRLASSAPGVKFPLQTIAAPIDEDASPLSHLVFGTALGLFYRYEPAT